MKIKKTLLSLSIFSTLTTFLMSASCQIKDKNNDPEDSKKPNPDQEQNIKANDVEITSQSQQNTFYNYQKSSNYLGNLASLEFPKDNEKYANLANSIAKFVQNSDAWLAKSIIVYSLSWLKLQIEHIKSINDEIKQLPEEQKSPLFPEEEIEYLSNIFNKYSEVGSSKNKDDILYSLKNLAADIIAMSQRENYKNSQAFKQVADGIISLWTQNWISLYVKMIDLSIYISNFTQKQNLDKLSLLKYSPIEKLSLFIEEMSQFEINMDEQIAFYNFRTLLNGVDLIFKQYINPIINTKEALIFSSDSFNFQMYAPAINGLNPEALGSASVYNLIFNDYLDTSKSKVFSNGYLIPANPETKMFEALDDDLDEDDIDQQILERLKQYGVEQNDDPQTISLLLMQEAFNIKINDKQISFLDVNKRTNVVDFINAINNQKATQIFSSGLFGVDVTNTANPLSEFNLNSVSSTFEDDKLKINLNINKKEVPNSTLTEEQAQEKLASFTDTDGNIKTDLLFNFSLENFIDFYLARLSYTPQSQQPITRPYHGYIFVKTNMQ
ncbi:hypothetical protein V2E24_00375 [Mycoplasmopsis ciconiae]|uniref:Lipoprotein n=1 Tax=Mycoplasmopsis ciconiae TaxID=561067 RepID=A0ABU7MLH4_9BACT|nr:hypothetical protein [Mycoplasmopsis ciconiae]